MDRTRLVGVAVPLGALRGSEGSAVGEFPDLERLALFCRETGIGLIQLLPVNDTGYESSPYFSLSSVALHPLYLRIADLDEAKGFKDKAALIHAEYAGQTRFPYLKILRAKMNLLREIYVACAEEIRKKAGSSGDLGKWIVGNPWVTEYAVYRRLKEANGERSWKRWERHSKIAPEEIRSLWDDPELRGEHLFWAWLQYVLDGQFGRAAKAVSDAGILLKGDLPIMMNDDSHDVWARPEIFVQNLNAGAPPDMYAREGQNWGFPLYDWDAQEADGFAWWKQRLAVAERYYGAYRIDHVLGFFRIWAIRPEDASAVLGRFLPYNHIGTAELTGLGFDKGRIRWVSRPHIPSGELDSALREEAAGEAEVREWAHKVRERALIRIGDEELWMFRDEIRGERDIMALDMGRAATAFLLRSWRDRMFFEYEKGKFSPTWYYRDSRAYRSLSDEERWKVDGLVTLHTAKSEKTWEAQGQKLLAVLAESSKMLPCAEDLGAVPACVPKVLAKLKILGLRVVRWNRRWELEGNPYVPFGEYPELSVCTPAVHDSSTVRQWWEEEAEQERFSGFLGFPSLPRGYNPGTAKAVLSKAASAASRIRIFQIQDLLHLSGRWYDRDPGAERINVPGTCNDFNWTYRLPATLDEIAGDADLLKAIAELSRIPRAGKTADQPD